MPVDDRMRAQVELILHHLPGAAAFPAPDRWNEDDVDDVDYLYHEYTILTRQQDADRVQAAIEKILGEVGYGQIPEDDERRQIQRAPVSGTRAVVHLMLPQTGLLVPAILDRLDRELGHVVATPDHVLYVAGYPCPATEPIPVPPGTVDPVPPPGLNAGGCGPFPGAPGPACDGDGVFIAIVDTGFIASAATDHSWLAGVAGEPDPITLGASTNIAPYAGHGTFVAGVARCMAPKAAAYVERAFEWVGANYESELVGPSLTDALSRHPDILEFTFCATTRSDHALLTFNDVFENRIRYIQGLVVVAPAGNDGKRRRTWPAAYPEVLSVGALAANWQDRASFSNHGGWVDVYAPGEDLINAFPSGTYVTTEPPINQDRVFDGMAMWSGTSFSTPIVAGLIAARMSATGENARQAADALLQLARSQAVPGGGAVLYPGQACC